MVRLVFRPYTQVRSTICTSVTLRASIRVSSDFALLRHSSPSFGSQQVCSYSNLSQKIMVGRGCALRLPPVSFLAPHGFSTHRLAYMLDSLVRVSRRVGWKPSASVPSAQIPEGSPCGARFDPRSAPRFRRPTRAGFLPPDKATLTRPPALRAAAQGRRIKPGATQSLHSLPPQQFQALFNSLFKGLFIFPSRYLFAIGLSPVFSLRRNLPPN